MISKDLQTILNNGLWDMKGKKYFSWSRCEGCNDGLGGSRQDIEFKYNTQDKETYILSICLECINKLS